VGVEAVAVLGLVGPVDAVAVELPRPDVGQVGVPDQVGAVDDLDAMRLLGVNKIAGAYDPAARVMLRVLSVSSRASQGSGLGHQRTRKE